jgi:hypothetical protein
VHFASDRYAPDESTAGGQLQCVIAARAAGNDAGKSIPGLQHQQIVAGTAKCDCRAVVADDHPGIRQGAAAGQVNAAHNAAVVDHNPGATIDGNTGVACRDMSGRSVGDRTTRTQIDAAVARDATVVDHCPSTTVDENAKAACRDMTGRSVGDGTSSTQIDARTACDTAVVDHSPGAAGDSHRGFLMLGAQGRGNDGCVGRVGDGSAGSQIHPAVGCGGNRPVILNDEERGRAGMPVDSVGKARVRNGDARIDDDWAGVERGVEVDPHGGAGGYRHHA